MFSLEILAACKKETDKKSARNAEFAKALGKKIQQILENPEWFKPLGAGMHGFYRVHIMKSFVLVYKIKKESDTVVLVKFEHHDNAYD